MTAGELIEKLKRFPDYYDVVVNGGEMFELADHVERGTLKRRFDLSGRLVVVLTANGDFSEPAEEHDHDDGCFDCNDMVEKALDELKDRIRDVIEE